MMLSTVVLLAVLATSFVPPSEGQKKYFVLLKPSPGRPYDYVGSYTREDGSQVAVYIPGKKPTSGKGKDKLPGMQGEAGPPAPPPKKEKKDHVDDKVYFSSQHTYRQVLAILDHINLSGVQSGVRADADRYLQNFKTNVLALISSVDDFSKIQPCFDYFTHIADTARNDLVQYYDSCKSSDEPACRVNGVTRYLNQLNGLMDRFYTCASQRVSG
uniref:Salivary secreted protein n=1 Tax=Culex tarsalis TaxID=7177 RepID=B8RJC6_CULTA